MDIILNGFGEVIEKLEQKRNQLVDSFETIYSTELARFYQKQEIIQQNQLDVQNVNLIYKELSEFMARNPDGKVLAKINDISDFMVKTTDDLEHMNSMESLEQSQCQVSDGIVDADQLGGVQAGV